LNGIVHFYFMDGDNKRNKENVKFQMGACCSSVSTRHVNGSVRVLLAGCSGASTESVVVQLVGTIPLKNSLSMSISRRASTLSQSICSRSSAWSLRTSQSDKEEVHRFNLDDVHFTLFCPVGSRPSFASASPEKIMQARVGKVEMVLFVVPLTWYNEEMIIEDEGPKENRMEFALSQFCTLCEMFASTDAGVGVILEDWVSFVDKLTMPKAGDTIGDHFLDFPAKDERNPTAAARYFERRFQEIYDAHSAWNNCFIHVARPDKRSCDIEKTRSGNKNKKNELAQFLLESAKLVISSYQMRSLFIQEESKSSFMSTGKNHRDLTTTHKDDKKGRSGNRKNAHRIATNFDESFTSVATIE